ncbi:PREDICTED: glucan endo-1,3-beta-glucosidase 14-like isoform X1 [Ipomoea nil]|uniref:glucan endo-1,3-beta-glucosidase 14-like isoform X1 n=1 Tax=Ipomoea nil TaxID=35883 RepID=UPI0009018418|nr:PREDICTED: glucan endo-1,3-beta-glucosidase 14-like isoform X1 [Ipomoea nil]
MATSFRPLFLLLTFTACVLLCSAGYSGLVSGNLSVGVGINYGQIGNDLPSPSRVAVLLKSLNITRVKLYDADPNVLSAFSNSEVEFVIGLGNEFVEKMIDPAQARAWIQQHFQPYYHGGTKITCITVGNEVLTGGNDTQMMNFLLPAMQSVHAALVDLGLSNAVTVTTAHAFSVLTTSFPPSAGAFRPDLADYIRPILGFLAQTKAPFLVNAYPYFAYKSNPGEVSLEYVLFQPNPGSIDPITNLKYDNMLYGQIDAVYSAMKAMGHADVEVKISETGWPSKGDSDEVGATPENAAVYNGNLLQRIAAGEGTPARPSVPVDIYVFALFNENLKAGPTSERNYGLYYPDGAPVYDVGRFGVQGYLPEMDYSASNPRALPISAFLLVFMVCVMKA